MSNLDFMKSIAGKEVFALAVGANHRSKQELKPCIVEKVGRKYVDISLSSSKFSISHNDDHYLKSGHHYDWLIFETEQEYLDHQLKNKLLKDVASFFEWSNNKKEKLTLNQLKDIAKILGIDVVKWGE